MDRFYECNDPEVIFERFDDEIVLINLETGRYYSLDPSGMRVWELLSRPLGVRALVDEMQRRYDGDPELIHRSVEELISRLQTERLIRPRAAPQPESERGAPLKIPAGAPFHPPVLARYDDMAELLMLDPVHDVGKRGWPHKPEVGDERSPRIEDEDVSTWPSLDESK